MDAMLIREHLPDALRSTLDGTAHVGATFAGATGLADELIDLLQSCLTSEC